MAKPIVHATARSPVITGHAKYEYFDWHGCLCKSPSEAKAFSPFAVTVTCPDCLVIMDQEREAGRLWEDSERFMVWINPEFNHDWRGRRTDRLPE